MYWTSIICNSHKPWNLQLIQPFMISLFDKRSVVSKVVEEEKKEETLDLVEITLPVKSDVQPRNVASRVSKRMSVQKTQDPLFWTLFLVKYGETEYKRASNILNTEMKEKKMVADHFYKLGSGKATSDLSIKVTKKGCNKMVEDIVTQPKLLLSSIYAFCHFYRFNIYIVDLNKKIYLEFLLDKHEQFENVILYRKQDKRIPEYFVDMPTPTLETQSLTLMNIKESFIGLISFEKSLKSVSNYKLSELHQIYTKLGMTDAPKKKHQLYEKIVVHCVWE